jgi:DNA-binding response OmpR family regulator
MSDPRVLIIEDHDVLRAMMFTILRHQPLAVDTAVSAAEAMEKVMRCDYALILIDMNLTNNDAGAFLESFREARPQTTTFVIAVREPNKNVFINADIVSAVLTKPLEIDTLAEVVLECAVAVEPPEDPLPCPPSESELRSRMERGGYQTN